MHLEYKRIQDFMVYYILDSELNEMYNEIFIGKAYYFKTKKNKPLIIDIGANIGMSVLYFKALYPDSKIICFEPNPDVFQVLLKNINANKLTDVTAVNAAVLNINTVKDMYIEAGFDGTDTLGGSLHKDWGNRRNANVIKVKVVNAEEYIQSEVDFMKIDAEGSEQKILTAIQNKIRLINEFFIEFHGTKSLLSENDLGAIVELLISNHYDFKLVHKPIISLLESKWANWLAGNKPMLYAIHAKRAEIENFERLACSEIRPLILEND